MLSAFCFILDQSKILLSPNGLTEINNRVADKEEQDKTAHIWADSDLGLHSPSKVDKQQDKR